ncbi:hypothetical protein, partial [Psychrobacter sp. TB55-MNA-CIBAN-0194]
VVETIGNTRPSWQIFKELGQSLGLDKFYPWENMQTLQLMQLNRDHSLLENIKKMGYVSYGKPLMLREPEMIAAFVKAFPNARSVDEDG